MIEISYYLKIQTLLITSPNLSRFFEKNIANFRGICNDKCVFD